MVRTTLEGVFTFETSTPQRNPQGSEACTSKSLNAPPSQHPDSATSGQDDTEHDISYPSSLFNFINEASQDVLTSKLTSALMLPQLQDKFKQAFMLVAKDVVEAVLREYIEPMQKEIKELRTELRMKTDELEQYSRRNSLRISGLPEDIHEEGRDTENIAMEVLRGLHQTLSPSDIDRCHRVGRKSKDKHRDIIIKFVNYNDRNKVIINRRKLRDTRCNVYINEDLTRHRSRLYKLARELKKQGRIESTWTRDGRVNILEQIEGRTRVIHDESELDQYRR
ncbi:uncharacterized protein LOC124272152 [Haliotis rubra]|uniref:uncharacterized protein LOC124272152 n=1 Tax=Haliotis rubra TaxID=36100 RepID=UPI001EE573CC|nr:uncharacterized protein LOC124272152 [Haliotis rubra]